MTRAPARSGPQRKEDVLAKLTTNAIDVWVASASAEGTAHLVPVSMAWDGERVVIAVEAKSATARNIAASGRARLGLGPTRDVVMIDATLDSVVAVSEAPAVADAFASQADWDPRDDPDGSNVFLRLAPRRIQAWREANELNGRTLMRDGTWLV